MAAASLSLTTSSLAGKQTTAIRPPSHMGTFFMTLYGENNCKYEADGTNPGILHCPSMGDGNNIGCQEEPEKSQKSATKQCVLTDQESKDVHRVVYCEW